MFLTRRDVEATNNESERALRLSVIFHRVTNGFRSEWGAKVYADLCSVVATGCLAGRTALAAIRHALAAPAPPLHAALEPAGHLAVGDRGGSPAAQFTFDIFSP